MKKIISLVFLLVALTVAALAQTGKIAGLVTDQKTSETLIGLTVKIDGTTVGISTDVEGRYSLGNLQPGIYKLNFSYMGYKTKSITDVEVKAGQVTTLNVVMDEDTGQALDEVVITVTARQESVGALYAQQKNSVTVSNGVSSEQIKRSPDRNTSDVLKRVSGTSIQDNKFVVVRGLSDRYNAARLNNAQLPSSEPDRKAFAFDIVPSNLVDNLVINKTASPDLPGDFSGGVVTIITKDFPDENFINVSAGIGYNSMSTFKDFKGGNAGKYDFLGFDDGSRQIPDGFPSTKRYNSLSLNQRLEKTRLLPNSFNTNTHSGSPIQNYQINWGAVKRFKDNGSFGSILSLTYRNAENTVQSRRRDYETDFVAYDFNDDIYRYSTNVGLLANLSYKKGNHKLSFKNILNKSFDDVYTSRLGINNDNGVARRSNTFDLVDKALINSQLDGEHVFGKKVWKLNWNANYTFSYRDQPDLRVQSYAKNIADVNNPSVPYLAEMPSGSSASRPLSRFYSRLDDYAYGAGASLTTPLFWGKNTLKIGGLVLLKDRTFNARVLGYVGASPSFDNSLRGKSPDEIFASENIRTDGFVLNEITNNNDKYDATSDLYAGYWMFDSRLGAKTRLVWGARGEYYIQDLNSRGFSGEKVDADLSKFDLLPSVNLTYSLTDKTNIRVAASKTISRPELREFAPFQYYDFISNSTVSGNTNLDLTNIYNADLKFERYPSNGEVLSVGVFFKHFDGPIEQIIPPGSNPNNRLRTFANAKSATNFGVEIELRKRLGFLSGGEGWLNNLTGYFNASYIHSKVDLSNTLAVEKNRALQGQSPYLINAGLQYTAPESQLGFSLLYNRIGQRIADVGFEGYPSIYENARDLIDLQLSKKVLKNKAEVKLTVSDIMNQQIAFYQNADSNKAFSSSDRVLNGYKPGTGATLSFSYNIGLTKKSQ